MIGIRFQLISGRADHAATSPRRSIMNGTTASLPKSMLPSLDPKSCPPVNVPSATVAAQRHSHLRRFHLHPQGSQPTQRVDMLDARQLNHGQRRSRTTRERWQRLGAARLVRLPCCLARRRGERRVTGRNGREKSAKKENPRVLRFTFVML